MESNGTDNIVISAKASRAVEGHDHKLNQIHYKATTGNFGNRRARWSDSPHFM